MSILDSVLGGGDSNSQDYLKQALAQFQNISTPTAQEMRVSNLPQETVQGTLTPEQIQAAQQGNTEFNNISLDPSTRQAEIQALGGFQNIAGSGGLDANALLGIEQAKESANRENAGLQGAIMQNAQAMGEGGSNATLTQRLLAAQNSANTVASQGMQQAAQAENNRQQALAAMANIGGNINASDYGQAANKAASQNAINASNTSATNQARTQNVANNMAGQQFNISNAQGVNANNTAANQGNAYYNAQLPQTVFNDALSKAQGAAGVNNQQAGYAQQASNNQAGFMGNLIGAAGTIGGAYLGGPAGAAIGSQVARRATQPNSATAGSATGQANASSGGVVPGKAVVSGDSERNDQVPILASPDELIIPRSVPKDGKHMEEFAKNAPVAGNPKQRVNLVDFMKKKKAA